MKSQGSRQGIGRGPKANLGDGCLAVSMEEPTSPPPLPPRL